MKRIIALLLVVLLGAGLSGCGLIMDAVFGEDEPEFGLGNFGEQTYGNGNIRYQLTIDNG